MKIFRMLFVIAFAPLVLVGCNSENASTGACTVSNTPTLTGRANTGLAGSSMGGYMTIYTGLAYPDVFGKLASFSTVALDDPMQGQNLRAYVEAAKTDGTKSPYIAGTTVYIDMGDQESLSYTTPTLLVENHTQMCASFNSAGYSPACSVVTGGVHDEGAWSKRFGDVFKLLFPKTS